MLCCTARRADEGIGARAWVDRDFHTLLMQGLNFRITPEEVTREEIHIAPMWKQVDVLKRQGRECERKCMDNREGRRVRVI